MANLFNDSSTSVCASLVNGNTPAVWKTVEQRYILNYSRQITRLYAELQGYSKKIHSIA